MRLITTLATASFLIAASATGIQQSPPDRPNVVLIMTDDAGYADTGSDGARDIRTPNIDSLARDGVKLTDFYANAMSCTPTRAGLIAGRYQQRYGIEFVLASPGVPGSDGGVTTVAAFATAADEKERVRDRPHRQMAPRLHARVLATCSRF